MPRGQQPETTNVDLAAHSRVLPGGAGGRRIDCARCPIPVSFQTHGNVRFFSVAYFYLRLSLWVWRLRGRGGVQIATLLLATQTLSLSAQKLFIQRSSRPVRYQPLFAHPRMKSEMIADA